VPDAAVHPPGLGKDDAKALAVVRSSAGAQPVAAGECHESAAGLPRFQEVAPGQQDTLAGLVIGHEQAALRRGLPVVAA
jgi:hypothetical protein